MSLQKFSSAAVSKVSMRDYVKSVPQGFNASLTPIVQKRTSYLKHYRPSNRVHAKIEYMKRGADFGGFILPEVYLAEIQNARIFGAFSTLITPDNRVIEDLSLEAHRELDAYIEHHKSLPEPAVLSGKSLLVGGFQCDVYYHWLIENLPRFQLISDRLKDFDHVIVRSQSDFQAQTLALIGIPKDRIRPTCSGTHYLAESLTVPSLLAPCGTPVDLARDALRTMFADQMIPRPDLSKRIYVSRFHSRRGVTNEDEVTDLLARYGIERVFFEQMSISEQIARCANADLIVAPHGAGCSNIVFARPGTRFLEIGQQDFFYTSYYILASLCNLEYYFLFSDTVADLQRPPQDRSTFFDLVKLEATIKEMLER